MLLLFSSFFYFLLTQWKNNLFTRIFIEMLRMQIFVKETTWEGLSRRVPRLPSAFKDYLFVTIHKIYNICSEQNLN